MNNLKQILQNPFIKRLMTKPAFLVVILLISLIHISKAALASKKLDANPEVVLKYLEEFDITQNDKDFKAHTLARHIGKTEEWIQNYLASHPKLKVLSTYTDAKVANNAIKLALKSNAAKISNWLDDKSSAQTLRIYQTLKEEIGYSLKKGEDGKWLMNKSDRAVVVLKKKCEPDSACVFYVLSSYPAAYKQVA